MSVEHNWEQDPEYLAYQASILAEIKEEVTGSDPLSLVEYTRFISTREWGRKRRTPQVVELIRVRDGRIVTVKEDWAYYLDDLAASIPGYEDNPGALLDDLRSRYSL